jgi:ribonuclease HII
MNKASVRGIDGPSFVEERAMLECGYLCVAGVDEAGRGAWAGPVAAAAVLLPIDEACAAALRGVNDSKALSASQRESLRERIFSAATAWCVGMAGPDEIDVLGILPATRLAMTRAIAGLMPQPEALLIDAVRLPELAIPQKSVFFADSISLTVAAASILAKTARDEVMRDMAQEHPGYGFDAHKGYGTAAHRRALAALGPCAQHRRSFRPIRALVDGAASH